MGRQSALEHHAARDICTYPSTRLPLSSEEMLARADQQVCHGNSTRCRQRWLRQTLAR
jgi:hypothetical protein